MATLAGGTQGGLAAATRFGRHFYRGKTRAHPNFMTDLFPRISSEWIARLFLVGQIGFKAEEIYLNVRNSFLKIHSNDIELCLREGTKKGEDLRSFLCVFNLTCNVRFKSCKLNLTHFQRRRTSIRHKIWLTYINLVMIQKSGSEIVSHSQNRFRKTGFLNS